MRQLHLELTTKCYLQCSACPRTEFHSEIQDAELSINKIKNITSSKLEFTNILICGNHGDAIYNPYLIEIITLLKARWEKASIRIATNGSFKPLKWWSQLAKILDSNDYVIFGIDGAGQSSAQYRVGSNWHSVKGAITELKKESSANICWQWILFKYNEPELNTAYSFIKNLNLDYLFIIKSPRSHKPDLQSEMTIEQAERIILAHENIPKV